MLYCNRHTLIAHSKVQQATFCCFDLLSPDRLVDAETEYAN